MQCCLFLSRGKSQHTKFQAFSEAMLLQPTPLGSWWKQLGIGERSAVLGSRGQPLLWKPLGYRDDSAQCPQSVPRSYRPKVKGRVPGADLGLPTTGCRNSLTGYMGTNTQEERNLQPWHLIGLRTEGTRVLLHPWAAFLEAHGWYPIGSAPSWVWKIRFLSHFPTEALLQGYSALSLVAEVAHLTCKCLLSFLPNALLCIDPPGDRERDYQIV